MQNFLLKHRNDDAAILQMDDDGSIRRHAIIEQGLMPFLGSADARCIHEWWNERSIPEGREGLKALLSEYGCDTPSELLMKNLALSLTDSYWICPMDVNLTWEQVNLYDNGKEVLHFHAPDGKIHYTNSPQASVTGSLDKRAVHYDDGWYLEKYGDKKYIDGRQNVNELFASELNRMQGWKEYTPYTVVLDESGICSMSSSKYFTDRETELISAHEATGGHSRDDRYDAEKELERFMSICELHGLQRNYVQRFMDYRNLQRKPTALAVG